MSRRVVTIALTVLVAFAIGLFAPRLGPIASVENDLADMRIAVLNPVAPPRDDIVVVAISESTFAHLQRRTPVDRAFLADLIGALETAGARAIGIDIFFGETTTPEADARLLAALNAVRVPTVIAWADSKSAPGAIAPWQDALWQQFRARIDNPAVSTGLGLLLRDPRDQVVREVFRGRAGAAGGIDRGFPVALAAAAGFAQPDALDPVALDYYGRPRAAQPVFLEVPAESVNAAVPVLWDRVRPLIEGRIALIGLDIAGFDRHPTPFSLLPEQRDGTAGVLLHAHALAQLIDARSAPGQPDWLPFVVAAVAAVGGALAGRLTSQMWLKALLLLLGPVAIAGTGLALFAGAKLMIHILAPSIGYVVAFIATELGMEAYHRREIRLLGGAFARYVSPAVIAQLRRDPGRLGLGGEERVITVLLTDLTGSVALGESMPAERFVAVLNGYLDGVSRIVLAHDGTIDKFIGDAVMALFGAPLDQPDHAARAVRCAVEIDAFAKRYAAEQRAAGIGFGETRIGVHTDAAVIGNFGGESRFDYTAIGRVTNLCARLEAANKQLGTTVLVSQQTVDRCRDLAFRPIGRIVLRGVTEPITVFSPAGFAGEAESAAYMEAYRLLETDPEAAAPAFAALAADNPDDPLVRLHSRRLQAGIKGVTLEQP
ncbi:MAG: adenylate/guanylate cyclase domain-containing protein [Alphaproteobacteria bacterium]